jgi:tetrahydromethanopterin S-methyltransferase subunit G
MSEKITELMLEKYINEEIMTKSELDRRLDVVLNKYTQHVDAKFDILENKINAKFEAIDHRFDVIDKRFELIDHRFEQVDKRFTQMDIKYNWLIGMIVTATIGIISVVIKLH